MSEETPRVRLKAAGEWCEEHQTYRCGYGTGECQEEAEAARKRLRVGGDGGHADG